jgi:hypothetical protein
MMLAATAVELIQDLGATIFVVGDVRGVQLAQGVAECRQAEPISDGVGKRVEAERHNWNTLLDETPQTPTSKPADPSINRHHAFRFVADLLDLGVDELESAAALFTNLSIEVELGFIGYALVDPPLVEPHDLEVSPTVINHTVDYQQPAARDSPLSYSDDPPAEQYPRAWLETRVEVRETGPVLVATGQVQ